MNRLTSPLQRSIRRFSTHRAVILKSPGSAKNFEETVRETRSPKGNELLIKVLTCGVSYLDVLNRSGTFPFIKTPIVLGHEVAGTVVQVGEGSKEGFKVGDKVVSVHWEQDDAWPSPLGEKGPSKTILGLLTDGGNQEFMTAGETTFTKVDSDYWDPVNASVVASTFGTVWQGAIKRGNLQPNSTVLVTGASGGVGSAAIQLCKSLNCTVIAVTSSPAKRSYLEKLGADHVISNIIDFNNDEVISKAKGVDMVIECTGGPTFVPSIRSLKPEGKLILIGNIVGHFAKLPLGLTILKSLNVIGSDSVGRDTLKEVFAYLEKNNIKPQIEKIVDLSEVSMIHQELERKQICGRAVLKVSDDKW